ncbi:hypothetical protein M9H77_35944 [Catharanthus roseus]|uniref:Uncharacterized protein n=1 Tax=Catharanthus roseus TaxID=4058 RepID=A0ACB9ZQG1_CATRO|nr:hypothetical protein M9H77_35944 [Catharanthus roseus]
MCVKWPLVKDTLTLDHITSVRGLHCTCLVPHTRASFDNTSHHALQWDSHLMESQEGLEIKVGLRMDLIGALGFVAWFYVNGEYSGYGIEQSSGTNCCPGFCLGIGTCGLVQRSTLIPYSVAVNLVDGLGVSKHTKVVTLRSGKELVETPPTIVEEEKEISETPAKSIPPKKKKDQQKPTANGRFDLPSVVGSLCSYDLKLISRGRQGFFSLLYFVLCGDGFSYALLLYICESTSHVLAEGRYNEERTKTA